jgi:hypothetical protein
LGQLAHYLDRTAGSTPTVICDTSPLAPANAVRLSDTDLILLMMNRKDAPFRYTDCGSSLVLTNGGEAQQIVLPEGNALVNLHPYIKNWLKMGEVVIQPDLPAQAVVRLNVSKQLADRIGRFTTTSPPGFAPEAPGGTGLAVPPVRFGGNLTFLGYDNLDTLYMPGGVVTSVTYWRVDGVLPPDLRLFTHILSDPAAIAAQTDTISVNVSQLQSRDIFLQLTFIPLPRSIPTGMYEVSIGAYLESTGERLDVLENGQPRGRRLFVGEIKVTK